jgi:hypothetical protein
MKIPKNLFSVINSELVRHPGSLPAIGHYCPVYFLKSLIRHLGKTDEIQANGASKILPV